MCATYKGPKLVLVIAGALIVTMWLLYVCFGKALVVAVYEERVPWVTSSIMAGRAMHPVDRYLGLADILFLKILLWCCLVLIFARPAQSIVVRLIRKVKRHDGPRRRPQATLKAAIGKVACLLLSIVLILVLWGAKHRSYVRSLRGYESRRSVDYSAPVFPVLDAHEALNLGWAHTAGIRPASSYTLANKTKPDGVKRVGVFGCSFVAGSEVMPGHDVASLLQARLYDEGIDNLEVINFGVGSYGVHQSFLLWKWVGREFDLDYVVLFPFLWHQKRDRSFIYSHEYSRVHARIISDEGCLKVLPVLGDTPLDATEIYYRSIPAYRYFRYDDKLPSILQCLLPKGRGPGSNPFYWKHPTDRQQETLDTDALILDQIAAEARNVIVVANSEEIMGLQDRVNSRSIHFIQSRIPSSLCALARAPHGHLSAIGNQMRADELLNCIVEKRCPSVRCLRLYERAPEVSLGNGADPLHSYSDVGVYIEDYSAASFLQHTDGEPCWFFGKDVDFREKSICSLLQHGEPTDPFFVPLPFMLEQSIPLQLSFVIDKRNVQVAAGTIESSCGVLGRMRGATVNVVGGGKWSISGDGWRLEADAGFPAVTGDFRLYADGRVSGVTLSADVTGGYAVFDGKQRVRERLLNDVRRMILARKRKDMPCTFALMPLSGRTCRLRAKAGQYVPLSNLKHKRGQLLLMVRRDNEPTQHFPMWMAYEVFDTSQSGDSTRGNAHTRPVR